MQRQEGLKTDPWAYLMRLLRARPRSIAEAERRMKERGFSGDAIRMTVDRAIQADLLDDESFTKLWVRDRMEHHPMSRLAVSQELRDKGVCAELVAATLDAEYPAVREVELARQLAESRFDRLRQLPLHTRSERVLAYLSRRGFSRGLAIQVIRTLEGELLHDDA